MERKRSEILKIVIIFVFVESIANILLPVIFMYTAGIEGTEMQVNTMSNISQCIVLFVAYHYIDHDKDNIKNNEHFIISGIYGIVMSLFLAIFNNLYLDGIHLIEIVSTDNDALQNIYQNEITIKSGILLFFTYGIIPAVCEEMFYRKMIASRLITICSEKTIVVFSGLLFAMAHLSWEKIIPMFLFGVLLMYSYMRYKNIAWCVGMHLIYNVVHIIIQYKIPLPSSTYFISSRYASRDEAILWGVRYITIGILFGIIVVLIYMHRNKKKIL